MKSDGFPGAIEGRSYLPPPTPVDPEYERDGSPVRIAVRQGWWRLFRAQDPKHPTTPATVCAELVTDIEDVLLPGTSMGGVATVSVGRVTVSDLEEMIGFAIPGPVAEALLRSAPRLARAAAGHTAPSPRQLTQIMRIPALRDDYLPWRASRVDLAGQPPTSYGRLCHTDPILRSWVSPQIRLDVVSAGTTQDQFGLLVREVAYRIWHDGRIVLSDRVALKASVDPPSDQAIRTLVARPKSDDRRPGASPPNRSDYYGWVQDQLRLLVARPRAPFVHGTRVHLDPRLEIDSLHGTVLARTENGDPNSGASVNYLVRPDSADLPGHRWQHLPRAGVKLPGWALRPTLTGPDPGLSAAAGPRPLAFGARIRSIDDPIVGEATVLRTLLRAGELVYEVLPDGPQGRAGSTHFIEASEAVPLRGTAWATVADLEKARTAAGVSRVPGEVLETITERRIIGAGDCARPEGLMVAGGRRGPVPDVSASPFPDAAQGPAL